MDLQLRGKKVAVWGAAGGIGAAIAEEFAREGASLALIDRSQERVTAIAGQLHNEHDVRCLALAADVTVPQQVQAVTEQVAADLGSVEHVVYAVAIGSGGFGFPSWNVSADAWQSVLDINLVGAVRVAHAVAPQMAERGQGSLQLISSVAGQIGSQTDPPYSASKAGLINFAQCLARDLAPSGVRVNAICPGMVRTPLVESIWQAWRQREGAAGDFQTWAEEKIGRLVPLGRWQEPADVAAMVVFLASVRGQNITGQTINVDGGYVMHS